MREEATDGQPVEALPRPFARAVVDTQELDELVQVPPIRDDGVRRHVALFLEVDVKLIYEIRRGVDRHVGFFCSRLPHARATSADVMPLFSIHSCMSRSARAANISRFCFLSRTRCGS